MLNLPDAFSKAMVLPGLSHPKNKPQLHSKPVTYTIWLVVWNHGILWLSIYWEFHKPNWRTPSCFRGVGLNHQPDDIQSKSTMKSHELIFLLGYNSPSLPLWCPTFLRHAPMSFSVKIWGPKLAFRFAERGKATDKLPKNCTNKLGGKHLWKEIYHPAKNIVNIYI
jgi:hypothetical protein